jgi:hypothetical protein
MSLLKYELKKLMRNRLSIVLIAVLMIGISVLVLFTYFDYMPKEYLKQQSGPIDSVKLNKVIEKYRLVYEDKDNFENGVIKRDVYLSELEKYHKLNNMLKMIAEKPSQAKYDNPIILDVNKNIGKEFYDLRIKVIVDNMKKEVEGKKYSDQSQYYILDKQQSLKTPFYFDYHDGWQVALGLFRIVVMMITIAICFCITQIFTYDHENKVDKLMYVTVKGRKEVINRRIQAAFIYATTIYFIMILIYSVLIFILYGLRGYNVPLQVIHFLSPYSLNLLQAYFLCMMIGYIACVMMVSFVIFLALMFKNIQLTVIVTIIGFLMPLFILVPIEGPRTWGDLMVDIQPINMMNCYDTIGFQSVIDIGSLTLPLPMMQLLTGVFVIAVFIVLAIMQYKHHEIKR